VNRLYFGGNLKWLRDRREFPDASADLVSLDPPFNSNADYNVLFREPSVAVSRIIALPEYFQSNTPGLARSCDMYPNRLSL
jgi:hypothetical protein